MVVDWHLKTFKNLSTKELYEILKIRQEVFIIEQECLFKDIDNYDFSAYHLIGYINNNNALVAYLRMILCSDDAQAIYFSRVLVNKNFRKIGLGRDLLLKALSQPLTKRKRVIIAAQAYLKEFYQSIGFLQISNEYLEDNLMHIKMALINP